MFAIAKFRKQLEIVNEIVLGGFVQQSGFPTDSRGINYVALAVNKVKYEDLAKAAAPRRASSKLGADFYRLRVPSFSIFNFSVCPTTHHITHHAPS